MLPFVEAMSEIPRKLKIHIKFRVKSVNYVSFVILIIPFLASRKLFIELFSAPRENYEVHLSFGTYTHTDWGRPQVVSLPEFTSIEPPIQRQCQTSNSSSFGKLNI